MTERNGQTDGHVANKKTLLEILLKIKAFNLTKLTTELKSRDRSKYISLYIFNIFVRAWLSETHTYGDIVTHENCWALGKLPIMKYN